jgi:hypothetical protein
MDVRLSSEQLALRDSVARAVLQLGPRTVADLADGERGAKLDAAINASGWRELRAGMDDGAPLGSAVDVAIIAGELGRGLADAPFLGPTLAAELRRLAGAPIAAHLETVALTADLGGLARDGSGAIAVDAAGSATALLACGEGLAEAALHPPGESVDLTRPSAAVVSGPPAPVARAVGRLTDEIVERWQAFGLAISCADLVGTMRGAVRLAVDYASARQQYGVPVGSFQAVQHLLADAHVLTEGSHSVALHAAWACDALPATDGLAAAALAKAYCARAAREVCETAIQVHGGLGNTWDCLAHVFLRRAILSTELLGGAGPSLARVLHHHGIRHHGIGGAHGLR